VSAEDQYEIRRLQGIVEQLRGELQAERNEIKAGQIVVMRRGTRLSGTSTFQVMIVVSEPDLLAVGAPLIDEVLIRAKDEIMKERERRST
jgi:hypothetical protein